MPAIITLTILALAAHHKTRTGGFPPQIAQSVGECEAIPLLLELARFSAYSAGVL